MRWPLVSVVTPTWHRHEQLLTRCIPSVQAQDYAGRIEHIVVSGPDPDLRVKIADQAPHVVFHEMEDNIADGGATPRRMGAEMATASLIAYLDDDNAFRPDHLRLLATELRDNPAASFAYSRMFRHGIGDEIGDVPLGLGQIDTSLIMHRRDLLRQGTWQPPGATGAPDWEVVQRWLEAGVSWKFLRAVTVDYYAGEPGGSR